ncbi:hypothetical protein D1007_18254 [Hordeum vulgare]|nr:hypothetical protein D1007_18254 [Hordeum vulgare]
MTDSVAGVRTRARRVQRVHGWLVRRLVCACTGVWPCRRCAGRQPVGEPRGDRERCVEPEREPRRVGAHRGCERVEAWVCALASGKIPTVSLRSPLLLPSAVPTRERFHRARRDAAVTTIGIRALSRDRRRP